MCGICGIVRFTDRPVAPNAVVRACHALRSRGPDHTGAYETPGGRVVLGATRLAVLHPEPTAHQPMRVHGGRYTLVYNGELYNFRELRRELLSLGHTFRSQGDTEVVGNACVEWGTDALTKFNGMFAFAFYDEQTRRGFLARDRFGIKPLMYAAVDGELRFASELHALTVLGPWDTAVDQGALIEHLQFGYIAHPRTIYRSARRLAPGHYMAFDADKPDAPRSYYQLPPQALPVDQDYAQARGRVRRALGDAVVRRRVSDVPIGAYLSGGLDSSIVVSHLAQACGHRIPTFSVGYADAATYDESPYARMVSRRFDTDHHELMLTESDVVSSLPSILDHLGEPVGDSSIIPTTLISRLARQHATVVLTGDGGDELFGGYWRYLGHQSLQSYQRLPSFFRSGVVEPVLSRMSVSKSTGLGNRARRFRKLLRTRSPDALARHIAWSRILSPESEVIFADRRVPRVEDERLLALARTLTKDAYVDDLSRVLRFDLLHQLPSDMLQKVDLGSMSCSLEARVPFLDHAVVECSASLPSHFKIHRGRRKRILVDAYRGHLPDEVLDRPKQGFEVPIGELFRGPLREMFRDVVSPRSVSRFDALSYAGVQQVFESHCDRRGEHADVLFALLSLCWWDRRAAV